MRYDEATLANAQNGDSEAFERLLAPYLRELRALCYRMAGGLREGDDLMQDSLVKAWKGLPGFKQRSDLRTWLYKVATNVCLDALDKRGPRLLPMDLGPAVGSGNKIGPPRLDVIWLEPCPADLYGSSEPSPAAKYETRQSVALAFLVAIQYLPPKQRAVLILQDVVGFQASETAELLNLSLASVNSALQRARATVVSRRGEIPLAARTTDDSALLKKYVSAWERADVDALIAVLREDAILAMPPIPQWLRGAAAVGDSIQKMLFATARPGTFRLVRTEANGLPALGAYQLDRESGKMRAMGLHVLELEGEEIVSITAFLDPSLFGSFALPAVLDF